MNKGDMVDALESHLRRHSTSLSKKPAFDPYYNTTTATTTGTVNAPRANSPVKRESAGTSAAKSTSTDTDGAPAKKGAPRRRQTAVGSATDTATQAAESAKELLPASSTATRTPSRALQRAAASIPLPSSPQAVTSLVERQSAAISQRLTSVYNATNFAGYSTVARESLSSARGITALFLALEAYAMQRATLPWREAFSVSVPFASSLGVINPITVSFPDFFVLLTSAFWAPVGLWLLVGVFAPALVGWLFNLSRAAASTSTSSSSGKRSNIAQQSTVDVVAFNAARGLGAWLVFVQKWGQGRFVEAGAAGLGVGVAVKAGTVWKGGVIDPETAGMVDGSLWGGAIGVLVESGVGVLAGLYEAVLRK